VRDDIPAEQLATTLVAVYEGLQLQWQMGPDLDLTASFETVLRMMEPVRRPSRLRKG
jgi:hypothetical protein